MEPLTALLALAAAHGASSVVKSLSGSDALGSLSGELVKKLAETESRIEERLAGIESVLDELLEQRYAVALGSGVRFMLDAIPASAGTRAHDLDRARAAFVEASAAARTTLQQAVAERYLLLCALALGRAELVATVLGKVESLALAAALEAMVLTERSRDAAAALMRRDGIAARRFGGGDRRIEAQKRVKAAALETVDLSARMLAEAAALGPLYGLPAGLAPLTERTVDTTFLDVQVSTGRDSLTTVINGQEVRDAYWSFVMPAGRPVRIGPLTLEIREGPTDTPGGFPNVPFHRDAAIGGLQGQPILPEFHLSVTAAPTLPVPLSATADHGPVKRRFGERFPTGVLRSGAADVKVALHDWQPGDRRRLTIFPEHNIRPLIEVWLS
jgi:hypothetical protein